tara:strand:+ start:3605 stop:4084 length:480 start_codon:yes stop_codon:yes gene_type:complete
MANNTIVGNATIYGVDGTVAYPTLAGTVAITENYMQSLNLTDEVDTAEARDQRGNVFGYNLYNHRRTCTWEIIFYGGSEAAAAAELDLPSPGALVAIAQDAEDGAQMPPILVGNWNYIGGGSISASNTDLFRVSLPCSQYNNPAATTVGAVVLQTIPGS